jgi:hypothetical protein
MPVMLDAVGAYRVIGWSLIQLTLPVLVLASARQTPSGQQPPPKVFSSKSEVVIVHVSVRDRKSRLVPGLPREAFSVFENGPQTLAFFENEDRPVTAGLVIAPAAACSASATT